MLVAVKPQMMGAALPALRPLGGGGTLFVSIAAGTPIRYYEGVLGARTPIVRAMPNTPAAGGPRDHRAGRQCGRDRRGHGAGRGASWPPWARRCGWTGEHQMDAVTAVSGSGPAYVFHLIEALAAAGEAEGLPPDLAMQLARATVTRGGGTGAPRAGKRGATAHQRDLARRHHGGGAGGADGPGDRLSGAAAARGQGRGRPRAGAGQVTITYDDFAEGRYPRGPHHPRRTLPRGAQARDQALGRFRRRDRRETLLGADHRGTTRPRRWSGGRCWPW